MKRKQVQLTTRTVKFKDFFGLANCDALRKRLEEAFGNKDSVFIFIATGKPGGGMKVTDAYMGICPHCVVDYVDGMVKDAEKHGLLSPHGRMNCN